MRIPWTCVLGQLRAIKIYALWYTAQYSPWIFSVGTRMIIILLPCLVTFYAYTNTNKTRNMKRRNEKRDFFKYLGNSSVKNRSSSPRLKIWINFYFGLTSKSPPCIVPLWRDSRKKVTNLCAGPPDSARANIWKFERGCAESAKCLRSCLICL